VDDLLKPGFNLICYFYAHRTVHVFSDIYLIWRIPLTSQLINVFDFRPQVGVKSVLYTALYPKSIILFDVSRFVVQIIDVSSTAEAIYKVTKNIARSGRPLLLRLSLIFRVRIPWYVCWPYNCRCNRGTCLRSSALPCYNG